MTIGELLAAIEAADLPEDTEVFGPSGPLHCVHVEDGTLVLEEADATLVRMLSRHEGTVVLWRASEEAEEVY